MFQLPHKLSELARIALDDVVAVEQLTDRYVVAMDNVFHTPGYIEDDERCVVCAAGAVMVQRLNADPEIDFGPYEFGTHNGDALMAIDCLREGDVAGALRALQLSGYATSPLDRDLPEYSSENAEWHEAMQELIDDLTEAGL
jgi:hypothetical protein